MIPGITAQASTGGSVYTPADFMAVTPTALLSLRKLNPGYSGPCIRVRRSTDSTEQDIGFSAGVLDVAALLTFCGAGNGFIRTWYDQSGNGNHCTQTTTSGSAQPQIVASGAVVTAGGYPAIYFNGASGQMYLNCPFHFLNSEQTIVYSARRTTAFQTQYTGVLGTQRSSRMGLGLSNSGQPNIQQLGTADKSGWSEKAGNSNTSDKWMVQGWATRFGVGGNGIIDVLSTFNGNHGAYFAMGGMGGTTTGSFIHSNNFQGYMRDLVVYPSFLTTQYRKSIEQDICVLTGVTFQSPYFTPSDAYGVPNLDQVLALRKVVPEYNGPCITVGNASGVLKEIGFDGSGELDTTALAAHCGSGNGNVFVWHDQLGNGNSPINDVNGPYIMISGTLQTLGGYPALVGGDNFSLNSAFGFILDPFTAAVAASSTSTAYRSIWSHTMSSAQMGIGYQATDGQQALMCNGVTHSVNGITTPTNTPFIDIWRGATGYTSGNYTLTPTRNGPDKPNITTNFSTRTGYKNHYRLWDTVSAANDFFQGPIAEMVIAKRVLDSTDRYLISNSMGTRFGVTIT